ncbi:MAG: hypothetical protein ACJ8C4_03970 [Gemmataceae bacterium]
MTKRAIGTLGVIAVFVTLPLFSADPPLELKSKTFTYQTNGGSLATVLDELAKQTGAVVGRTKAETDRVLRLECKNVPFWEALERIAKESDHRIVFSDSGRRVQLAGGGDITYRETPVSFDRVFRISARRVQCTTDLEMERSYTEVTLGLNWEPGFAVFLVEQPGRNVAARDNAGQDLRVDDPGQGRIPVGGAGIDLPLRLVDVPRSAKTIALIEGRFSIVGATKMHEFTFEKPVAAKDAKDARTETKEGVTVRLRTDFSEKADLWSARIELEYPEGGPQIESFEASAWMIDNDAWMTTADGKRKLECNGGYELVAQSERKAVVVYRFIDEADRKLGKPEDWVFHIRTPAKLISTDVKFKLENIPLP